LRAGGGSRLHGLQLWVALPESHEETEPAFDHYPAETFRTIDEGEARLRVLAGSAYGVTSPVKTLSPLFYVEARLDGGKRLPLPREHEERAVYVVHGGVSAGTPRAPAGQMLVFHPGADVTLRADADSHLMLLGGAPLGPRHIFWNFVSSSKERIEQAKEDWRQRRFPSIPGDDQ